MNLDNLMSNKKAIAVHFAIGVAIGAVGRYFHPIAGISVAFAAGCAKELFDVYRNGWDWSRWDWGDVMFTTFGGIVGTGGYDLVTGIKS